MGLAMSEKILTNSEDMASIGFYGHNGDVALGDTVSGSRVHDSRRTNLENTEEDVRRLINRDSSFESSMMGSALNKRTNHMSNQQQSTYQLRMSPRSNNLNTSNKSK